MLTFEPHPKAVIHDNSGPARLTLLDEKVDQIRLAGPEALVILRPTMEFLQQSPREFVRSVIVDGFAAGEVVEGPDFRFGHDSKGDLGILRGLGEEYGFAVGVAPAEVSKGRMISSTMIRSLLALGEVRPAGEALGRPYAVSGTVVKGTGQGRDLGFPTANIRPPHGKLLPRRGVYVVEVLRAGEACFGMANLGHRPTFGGEDVLLETHLFDYSARIYGEDITVQFLRHLRDEAKFPSSRHLKAQLQSDLTTAREFLRGDSSLR